MALSRYRKVSEPSGEKEEEEEKDEDGEDLYFSMLARALRSERPAM